MLMTTASRHMLVKSDSLICKLCDNLSIWWQLRRQNAVSHRQGLGTLEQRARTQEGRSLRELNKAGSHILVTNNEVHMSLQRFS